MDDCASLKLSSVSWSDCSYKNEIAENLVLSKQLKKKKSFVLPKRIYLNLL